MKGLVECKKVMKNDFEHYENKVKNSIKKLENQYGDIDTN